MLQSAQGRKMEGSVARRSFAGVIQSISHTGHFMLLGYDFSGIDSFSNVRLKTKSSHKKYTGNKK
jgi:hypothetical protein